MKHVNLLRALPVWCALAGAIYFLGAEISRSPAGDVAAGVLGIVAAGTFTIYIRLGYLPWFEKKDGKADRLIIWMERVFPWLRAPRK